MANSETNMLFKKVFWKTIPLLSVCDIIAVVRYFYGVCISGGTFILLLGKRAPSVSPVIINLEAKVNS